MIRPCLTTMVVLGAIALGASAQNYGYAPTYGSVRLSGGFTPDPHTVSLQAGGGIDVSNSIGGSCVGMISDAPDYRVSYSPSSYPLIISVSSGSDTTLVVNAPDGRWYCDDDSGQGNNPSVRFNSPQSGQYDIWVGTYSSGSNPRAVLNISEVNSR